MTSNGDVKIIQRIKEEPQSSRDMKKIQRCEEGPLRRERQCRANYLNGRQTTVSLGGPCLSSSNGIVKVGTGRETAPEDSKSKGYRSRQFTAKYLSKQRDQKHSDQSEYLQEENLMQPNNNDHISHHIEEQPKRSINARNRYFTAKYLTTRQDKGDLNVGTTNQNALRSTEDPSSSETSGRPTGDYHKAHFSRRETSGRPTSNSNGADPSSRETSGRPTGDNHRKRIRVNGCRTFGS
ncbi:uncharacterized protein LOC117337184 [Pecten maximus]|uniref:uncharacterized protein LOC117337184 n=1 Tax=Pecten maximus TaxID=6579 RepID=UPI001458507C|nr:uncharacterized protein LOC117337184 [Pecten maximus]